MARLTKRAQKDLADLPDRLQEKARNLIRRLDAEPGMGKKLQGQYKGLRSLWLGRSHRIIYSETPTVTILTIPPRRDAYR